MEREEAKLGIEVPQDVDAKDEVVRSIVPSRGLMIKRERLLRELCVRGAEAGITVICAPDGMGKTALLLQYIAEVSNDPARGSARLIDAQGLDPEELYTTLRRLPETMSSVMHPLVAVDNLANLGKEAVDILSGMLRGLREKGFECVLACKPVVRDLLHALGDSYKIDGQALLVRPREYSDWARVLCIDNSLDVYGLTQGVPSLVAALQTIDGAQSRANQLERAVVSLYASVLDDLRQGSDALHRLASLLLLVGDGEFRSFSTAGLRIREETVSRLARDYPFFGINAERTSFSCLMMQTRGMDGLCRTIASERPMFAKKALQVLMGSGRVDQAVRLAEMCPDFEAAQEIIEEWPLEFALSGNALFVNKVIAKLDGEAASRLSPGMELAIYAGALVSGEYRLARAMSAELHRKAHELHDEIDSDTLRVAYALADIWRNCPGVALPELTLLPAQRQPSKAEETLLLHRKIWDVLIAGDGIVPERDIDGIPDNLVADHIDIPSVFLLCDRLINQALHGDMGDVVACDKRLQELARHLRERKADPVADLVRMTAATCRLMEGMPIVDERAFVDAGTAAVRTSDLAMQLYCLLGEGWQALEEGQVVNARFRAQQVLRLADETQDFIRTWAQLLERSAHIANTAKFALSEEADLADLSRERVSPVEAWCTALLLSAAGHSSELSAWYSLHRASLLDARFRPLARQAMHAVGERADALRCLLPRALGTQYETGGDEALRTAQIATYVSDTSGFSARAGQIEIRLFGGFKIERNGHVLTDSLWRRKRLCALTSRLVLVSGAFVDRRMLTEEMWPTSDYRHARESLYTLLSTLREAFGQQQMGPQYILTQGNGIAINSEYVMSDVMRFDMLARDILLKRTGTSGRQIIESCLKMEELYTGPLYVADSGDTAFFVRARQSYAAKFIDCMLRGVDAALELEDLPSASWLIEAAQRQAPYREDVMRKAMHIFDRSGRRREIVEMYNSHLHYLQEVVHGVPEDETRLAYESIMGTNHLASMM